MNKLPKSITPNPIKDALVELRFNTETPSDAVFGIIYSTFKNDFGKPEKLPILQLPEGMRNNDQNLKFKPHYRLSNENFVFQIGPNVITISSYPEYIGWDKFSQKIINVFDKVEKLDIINEIVRFGIRYINFFEEDVFNNINLEVLLNDQIINYKNTYFRTELEKENLKVTLQVANNATNGNLKGSIIDIDTFKTENLKIFFKEKKNIIDSSHLEGKKLFFSLLKDEFVNTLNPEY